MNEWMNEQLKMNDTKWNEMSEQINMKTAEHCSGGAAEIAELQPWIQASWRSARISKISLSEPPRLPDILTQCIRVETSNFHAK